MTRNRHNSRVLTEDQGRKRKRFALCFDLYQEMTSEVLLFVFSYIVSIWLMK